MAKKLINFTDRSQEMVEEIMAEKGYRDFTATIHAAVADFHARTFPQYTRTAGRGESAIQRVRRKQGEKERRRTCTRREGGAL